MLIKQWYAHDFGAGDRDRTDIISLEGWGSTIELHPHTGTGFYTLYFSRVVEGEGFEPPKAEPADLQSAPVDRLGTPPD